MIGTVLRPQSEPSCKSARRPKERDPERSERDTPVDWLARTRVSLRTDFALAVLGAYQEQYNKSNVGKTVVDWPLGALRTDLISNRN